jgi:trehalose 6-phosphate phosphatase
LEVGVKLLERQETYEAFIERLKFVSSRVLLLDYDGTLAPFHFDRNQAFPYSDVPALLLQIINQGTRVVLVSGRRATELVFLCGLDPHPEIWGSHGLERLLPDGTYEVDPLPAEQSAGLEHAAKSLRSHALESRIEEKPGGIAVHWRGLSHSEAEKVRKRVMQLWAPFLSDCGLTLLKFEGGVELRAPGKNKGDAVRTILSETDPSSAIAYLGDDQTDEDAFRALKGKGLAVLVRPESRLTSADIWLRPPQELLTFLKKWLRASGGEA